MPSQPQALYQDEEEEEEEEERGQTETQWPTNLKYQTETSQKHLTSGMY